MSDASKAKAIADLLMSNVEKWWSWGDILEGLIPGFSNVPDRIQSDILESYKTYMTHAREELDDRMKVLLRDGRGQSARWKIATDAPSDAPYISRVLVEQKKRGDAINGRVDIRIDNLKEDKILPRGWKPPALGEGNEP